MLKFKYTNIDTAIGTNRKTDIILKFVKKNIKEINVRKVSVDNPLIPSI
tara:strand:+ start:942 stop:1088 length:147 start_codon:yes stop_codon:yes gene_type:complete